MSTINKKIKKTVTLLCCALSCAAFAEDKINIHLEGIDGELKQNVEVRLSSIIENGHLNNPRAKRLLTEEIKKGLRAKGYYEPTITFDNSDETKKSNDITVHIDPGKPVINEKITISYEGDATTDKDYLAVIDKFKEYEGKVVDHGIYESAKKQLLSIAMKKGYFDADFVKNQLGISLETLKAYWDIDFDSGKRFRFGHITYHGSQIREEYLRALIPFNEAEFYTSSKLSELNQYLSSTNWFQTISVIPKIADAGDDKMLPIDVYLTPRKPNNIELGAGYSTSIGPRAKMTWGKPWVNSYGHSAQTFLSVSGPEQELSSSYKIPLKKDPLVHYYTLQSSLERTDNNDTLSDSFTFSATRHWDFRKSWVRSIGFTINYDDFTQGDDKHATFLLYPTISISRVRSDGSLMPMWGDYQQYSMSYSNKAWLSNAEFWSFKATNTWIRSIGANNRFILRGSFGFLDTNDFSKIPPSLRYFAGGDRSIRGYSYESVSPSDSKGKLTGGSRLATGSLEYQYNIKGSWWGALFVDSGTVSHSFKNTTWKTGVGAGIRWASPVGPIKLDIAVPINEDKNSIHFYIGLGSEL